MRGAIASVEIFVFEKGEGDGADQKSRRLTLTVTAPNRDENGTWSSRVALADLHRPETLTAEDSVSALAGALARAESWLDTLRGEGAALFRDRAGETPFTLA